MRSNIQIHNMDCMEALREMETNQLDLAIVDPPYGIGADKGVGGGSKRGEAKKFKGGWDSSAPEPDYFDELRRVSKNQIIWGANHFIDNFPFNCSSPCWLLWDKWEGLPTRTFADGELAWTSFKSPLRIFRFQWDGMIQQDMKNKEHRIHPTQKPVALYKWLLQNYAKEGDKILDTHIGSGSIAVACHDAGFDLTGYELDEDYYKAAMKRLEEHRAQGQFEFA